MDSGIIVSNCIQPVSSTTLGHLGAELTINPKKGTIRRKVVNRYDSPRSQTDRHILKDS